MTASGGTQALLELGHEAVFHRPILGQALCGGVPPAHVMDDAPARS